MSRCIGLILTLLLIITATFPIVEPVQAESSSYGTFSVTVPSTQPWTDTGLTVSDGDEISITASGLVSWDYTGVQVGPDGRLDPSQGSCGYVVMDSNVPAQSLVGNIASSSTLDGKGFFVGSSFTGTVGTAPIDNVTDTSGKLFLGFNDGAVYCDRTGYDGWGFGGDNHGSFTVTITITSGSPPPPAPSVKEWQISNNYASYGGLNALLERFLLPGPEKVVDCNVDVLLENDENVEKVELKFSEGTDVELEREGEGQWGRRIVGYPELSLADAWDIIGFIIGLIASYYGVNVALPPSPSIDSCSYAMILTEIIVTEFSGKTYSFTQSESGETLPYYFPNICVAFDPWSLLPHIPGGGGGAIITMSPVDISVLDPDGLVITKDNSEINGAMYLEGDIDNDGDNEDFVLINNWKMGDYVITISAEPGAQPTDTFSLVVGSGQDNVMIAENVQIQDIPTEGYLIRSTEEGISLLYSMQDFVIGHMNINWGRDFRRFSIDDTFSLAGRIRLPEGITVEDLQTSANVTLMIADEESSNDVIQLSNRSLRRFRNIWTYWGDEQPPGEGINLKSMTVWWAPDKGRWDEWARFHIRGVLELSDEIGFDTKPAQATVTIEIPVSEGGSLVGEQIVEFEVKERLRLWKYNACPKWPRFPYGRNYSIKIA